MNLNENAFTNTIIKELTDMKIETQYLRGHGYDGTVSMSGRVNGVQSCIKNKFKTSTINVYCS